MLHGECLKCGFSPDNTRRIEKWIDDLLPNYDENAEPFLPPEGADPNTHPPAFTVFRGHLPEEFPRL